MSPVPPFGFATATRVLFGAGRAAELPDVVGALGARPFVCTGKNPARHAQLLDRLPAPRLVHPVPGEPSVETARLAVAAARAHRADVVVAIGGGSVLDLGKAVAALLGNGTDPLDHLEVVGRGRPFARPSAPFVAVPTTAGTGAEVTANAVLAVASAGVKASLRGPSLLPSVALVDPLLTLGCPPAVTAASGLDALTQCLEPLVSSFANPLTDALAREGLQRAGRSLRAAYADGGNVDARTDLALCGLLGGMALANAKLGAVHGFAGVVGGMVDVPHGEACAALLVPVVEMNLRAAADDAVLERYASAARSLTGRANASVADLVAWLHETVAQLGVRGLGAFGLSVAHADEVVAKAAGASSMRGNPVPLNEEQLREVFAAAL
ncbi:iron-containing alcohol dehydrogenase [Dactylosporangium sp. CS-047395]|uniref:iron-containing alcohol dehydrogenase n=1 Tax=Dactylosporangium sp. CS-047395 TaxID=3239936 RepID=UPI003D94EFD8